MSSPWYGAIFIAVAICLAWSAIDVLREGVVTVTDKMGMLRVFRGEYAAMFAWCYLAAAMALAIGGVAVIVRERRRTVSHTSMTTTFKHRGRQNVYIWAAAILTAAIGFSSMFSWQFAVAAGLAAWFTFPGKSLTIEDGSVRWRAANVFLRRVSILDITRIDVSLPPHKDLSQRASFISRYLVDISCPGVAVINVRAGPHIPFCTPSPLDVFAAIQKASP